MTLFVNKSIYILIILLFTSCISNDDFETPEIVINQPQIEGDIISIQSILEALKQAQNKDGEHAKIYFEETHSLLEGFVVSDDRHGNFFKQLVIQDNFKNPISGIRLMIDVNPLYVSYELGQKVTIRLDELTLGIENGVPTLGVLNQNSIIAIPAFKRDIHIIRSLEIEQPIPKTIQISDLSEAHINQLIALENVQFVEEEVFDERRNTYASAATDLYTGDRLIENCISELSTVVSTSTYASFKGFPLPKQSGNLSGILTKNYYGDAYNIILNSPLSVNFTDEKRCERSYLACEGQTANDTLVFFQNFTGVKTKDLEALGWINQNVTGGVLDYAIGKFGQDSYASITGFKSRESVYEVWLITPEIDMTMTTEENLTLDIQAVYDNGNILSVWVTNDYTDAIKTATWVRLDAFIPRGPLNSFGSMTPTGPIALNCLEGKIRIGFKYQGGEPGVTTRYHLDNIKITGK